MVPSDLPEGGAVVPVWHCHFSDHIPDVQITIVGGITSKAFTVTRTGHVLSVHSVLPSLESLSETHSCGSDASRVRAL